MTGFIIPEEQPDTTRVGILITLCNRSLHASTQS